MGKRSGWPALIGLLALTLSGCGGGSEKTVADAPAKTAAETADEILGLPPDWSATNEKSAAAYRAGKYSEALTILEDYAKAHPTFADVELMLGDNYWTVPANDKAAEREYWEKAVVHYRRGFELAREDYTRTWGARGLLHLFGPRELNRPADAEPVARDYVKAHPSQASGYAELATALRRLERHDEATRMLLEANGRIEDRERREYFEALVEHAEASPSLPSADQRQLLADARPFVDGLLKADPKDFTALGIKAKIVAVEARLEPNAAKRKALEAESKRLEIASSDALSESIRR